MTDTDAQRVADAIAALDIQPGSWPGGYPGEIEACLIDAVMSIRARYGQPDNGVRGRVRAWRDRPGASDLDDLRHITADRELFVKTVGGKQKLSGGLAKPEAIYWAAEALTRAGCATSADLAAAVDSNRLAELERAYCSIKGLGPVTFNYLLMLHGTPGVKADTWVRRFVADALGVDDVSASLARHLLTRAAATVPGPTLSDIDHAVWRHASGRPRLRTR